ncbi:MAG TPA: hypothetical protein VKC66_02125 [Xanthobacteraceae bacterium]|nr:hypothetical protein [Xanthobacteraceae bacterium]
MDQRNFSQRWHTTIIIVYGEVIDAAASPALIAENLKDRYLFCSVVMQHCSRSTPYRPAPARELL